MAEKRFFRLQSWLMILLVLTALSLMSHYVADAVHNSVEACWSCRVQGMEENRQPGERGNAVDLHCCFLLNKLSAFRPNPTILTLGEMTTPLALTWIPPTPVRPPIAR